MSTIGWTTSINASSVLDKVQHAQQMQDEAAQVQAKDKALEEERLRQTTVRETAEDEKVRLREEEKRKQEEGKKRRHKRQAAGAVEGAREDEATQEGEDAPRTVDIRV